MKAEEIINSISSLKNEVYDYIVNTEHWLFYWISNKEVQEFIKEYPEDFEDRVHLSVDSLGSSTNFRIEFEDHPNDVSYIQRYAVLATFKDSVKARWMEWNGKIKEMQIEEKEKALLYFESKINEIKKEISELKKE